MQWILDNWETIGLGLAFVVTLVRSRSIASALTHVMGKLENAKGSGIIAADDVVSELRNDVDESRVSAPVQHVLQTAADVLSGRKVSATKRVGRFLLGNILRKGASRGDNQ